MDVLTPEEINQEVINTLAMVENELCFGGNWEDAKARINRCRLVLAQEQLAKVHRPDREKIARIIHAAIYGDEWLDELQEGDIEISTYDKADQISALFNEEEIRKQAIHTMAKDAAEARLEYERQVNELISKCVDEVKEAKREERERIFAIMDDYGVGDITKGLTWIEFDKKYGIVSNMSSEPLVDILTQALKGEEDKRKRLSGDSS